MFTLPLPFPLSNYRFIETVYLPQPLPKYGVRGDSDFRDYWICLTPEVTEWISENIREIEFKLHSTVYLTLSDLHQTNYAIAFSSEDDAILFKLRWW